ncbi:MAG TPA: GPO family capsid scaffolding protein [Rhodocyclaceae bacterium]|nr:GPO family capsid scaffolding protein [Rhodocyclaceae bacterium]
MPVSKPFAIATEGPTIDGRNISRDWIVQMAKSYDPKVYTAVTNLEHYLSSLPDSVFSAYGKVVSLGTQEVEILGDKKLQLTAVVDVSQAAADLQKSGKKAFASIEVKDNFINKGVAYLTGLAFTDTPASVGTESMKFSAIGGGKENVFTFGAEIGIEFEPEGNSAGQGQAAAPAPGDTLFAKVKALLGLEKKDSDTRFADIGQAVEAVAGSQKDLLANYATLEKKVADLTAAQQKSDEAAASREQEFAELKATLDKTPDGSAKRPAATGGNGEIKTDC